MQKSNYDAISYLVCEVCCAVCMDRFNLCSDRNVSDYPTGTVGWHLVAWLG